MAWCNCDYTPPESRPCMNCRRRKAEGLDLDELAALCENATPGEWQAEADYPGYVVTELDGTVFRPGPNNCRAVADADFVIAVRTAVPELIARVRELEAELGKAKSA